MQDGIAGEPRNHRKFGRSDDSQKPFIHGMLKTPAQEVPHPKLPREVLVRLASALPMSRNVHVEVKSSSFDVPGQPILHSIHSIFALVEFLSDLAHFVGVVLVLRSPHYHCSWSIQSLAVQ